MSHVRLFAFLPSVIGLAALSFASAQTGTQPLPGSAQSGYFVFKLASSLQLADTPAPQCETARATLGQTAKVTVSHSFVLPQDSTEVEATLNRYVQSNRFSPVAEWNPTASGGLHRQYSDPDVSGYRYAVDLYSLDQDSTAMCVSILSLE